MRAISIFLLSCCLSHTLWAKTPVGSDIAFDKNSANLLFADEQLFDFHGKIDVNRNSVAGGGMAYPADTAGVFFCRNFNACRHCRLGQKGEAQCSSKSCR